MLDYFTLSNFMKLIQQIVDVLCVWAVVYYCLKIVKNNSRTIQIFKGILLIIIVKTLAGVFGLHTIENLAGSIMTWGVVAIIVIFQPEIRNILEKIGQTSLFSRISTLTVNERENLVDELVKACAEMSKTKTGALISIEQGHSLSDYIKTGTPMNSVVSSELLCSIFQYGTPLHDGAVIIQGVKIACAAAYFPPTTMDLPTSYGARHRAAVGISEITDSITIVVSEETGNISIAQNGKLAVISEINLREFLMEAVCNQQTKGKDADKKDNGASSSDVQQGKKPSVFAHYFKGKNKRKNTSDNNKYTKKKKQDMENQTDKEVVVGNVEKMEIEDLTQSQESPLDQLFETIIEPEKKDVDEVMEHEVPETSLKETSSQGIEKDTHQEETEKKEETEVEKPKKRKRRTKMEMEAARAKEQEEKEAVEKEKELTKQDFSNMANDLFNDIIQPEAIVLHYEKEDEDDTFDTSTEGRNS